MVAVIRSTIRCLSFIYSGRQRHQLRITRPHFQPPLSARIYAKTYFIFTSKLSSHAHFWFVALHTIRTNEPIKKKNVSVNIVQVIMYTKSFRFTCVVGKCVRQFKHMLSRNDKIKTLKTLNITFAECVCVCVLSFTSFGEVLNASKNC